ncbi:MarR family transcriptional regulator, partial [Pseudomonas aeruginosa]|nr:MarR family transcriptional regulator [Pseudomonas aeruginosa]
AGLDERLLAGLGSGPEEEALTLVLGKLLRAFDGLSRVTQ